MNDNEIPKDKILEAIRDGMKILETKIDSLVVELNSLSKNMVSMSDLLQKQQEKMNSVSSCQTVIPLYIENAQSEPEQPFVKESETAVQEQTMPPMAYTPVCYTEIQYFAAPAGNGFEFGDRTASAEDSSTLYRVSIISNNTAEFVPIVERLPRFKRDEKLLTNVCEVAGELTNCDGIQIESAGTVALDKSASYWEVQSKCKIKCI